MMTYTLCDTRYIVGSADHRAGRPDVFRDIAKKSLKIRLPYRIFVNRPLFLESLLSLVFGSRRTRTLGKPEICGKLDKCSCDHNRKLDHDLNLASPSEIDVADVNSPVQPVLESRFSHASA